MTYRPLNNRSLNSRGCRQYSDQFYGSAARASVILRKQDDSGECAGAPYSTARGSVTYTGWYWFEFDMRRVQNYFH